jgi:CheY-like chemotaxis protein
MSASLLVAEDHEAARELIFHALEGEGYNLVFANSGTEASSVLRQRQFDAALIDVSLPGLSGAELCRRIKAQHEFPPTPVILMSGALGARELAAESHEVGADAFLAKPFSLEELRTVLRAFTKIREQAIELDRLRVIVAGSERAAGVSSGDAAPGLDWSLPYHDFMKLARKAYFEHALVTSRGNKSLLARKSGLDRSTLYVHLRNLGMLVPRRNRSN